MIAITGYTAAVPRRPPGNVHGAQWFLVSAYLVVTVLLSALPVLIGGSLLPLYRSRLGRTRRAGS